jgi:type I restriction enzyme, S subunit
MEVKAGYKQTEVGIIPDDWKVAPVGASYEICNNLRLPISRTIRKQMEGPYPYYGPTSIQGYINEFRVEGEYALIGEDGDHFLKWQEQSMTLLVHGRFNVNNHAHLVKGTKNLTAWFYYYFAHRDITPHLTRQGAGRFKLNKRTLLEIPCALPPTIAEQEAIVEALSVADALIEALEQLLAKKRQVKQGAMQELLTGKRRLPGFSGEWALKRLGEIVEIVSGGTPSTRIPDYWNGNIDWCTPTDITSTEGKYLTHTEKRITDAGLKNSSANLLPKGALLLCSRATIGEVKIAIDRICTNQGFKSLICSDQVYNEYLYYVLLTMKSNLIEKAIGSTFLEITKKEVSLIELQIPSASEQTAIAEILSDMDAEIAALEEKLSKARQVKQGMMSVLLTGRVRLV